MRRLLACFVVSSLLAAALSGCGAVTIVGTLNPNGSTVSGFITGVNLTNVPGASGPIVVTIVTFQQTLGFTTSNFCGDLRSQFPMNAFAQVTFHEGSPCSTVVVIVIS